MLQLLRSVRSKPSLVTGISIRKRVIIWGSLLAAAVGFAGYLGFSKLHAQITRDASEAAEHEMEGVQDILNLHRQLYLVQVRASIDLLKRETLRLGPPHISGYMEKDGKKIPNLMFGSTPMANDSQIIDSVEGLMGAKTTILVRDGDSFIRIATNILEENGARAVNTEIDPHGPGIAAMRKGEGYAGIINIMGISYIGEDDPIRDDQGQIIGAWFVGFEIKNLGQLVSRIESKHILENGFVALFDTNHKLVAESSNAKSEIVKSLCEEADLKPEPTLTFSTSKWSIRKETFDPWDYSVISATYIPDLGWRALNSVWLLFSVVGLVAVAALITQAISLIRAQQLKDEAEKARLSAEEASRTKSAFLANMSHELRTPLNAIIGYSEMLIEEVTDREQEDLEPDLRKIQGSGKHLLSLINDILDLSKIEAGKMTIYLEEFSVPPMIREIAATIQPLLVKNGNQLEIDCPEEVGSIYMDVTKTRQILFNLLSNASKFTKGGKVKLKCTRDSRMIHFSVQDNGVGMAPEVQQRLFKEFSQADDSTTRKYGGTGLGLAISKKFCEMLGGAIRVESASGVGTTFFVDLPLKAAVSESNSVDVKKEATPGQRLAESLRAEAPAADVGTRPLVLVIDDDREVQDLMQRILEKEGYQVKLAGSGQEALEMAETLHPCLITLDIMMPGMDGWAVLEALKKNTKLERVPVVIVSLVDNKPMALALGATDYVAKPIDRERILEVLRKHGPLAPPLILIIEDDINSYEVLSRVFEKEGLKVAYAPNGRVALEMVDEVDPNLIVLDLTMPEMNGFEFIAELRRREKGSKIPVIVLSGRDLSEQERDLLGRSAQKTILKGALGMHDLADEVRRHLPRSRNARS